MSGKLDKSLDDILKGHRQTKGRGRRASKPGKPNGAIAAPVGGIKKVTRVVRTAVKGAAPTGPSANGESKIIVSNLPADVTEAMMKEYFGKTISPVKRVLMSYGPDGRSRGICTVIFSKRDAAAKAAKEMNGVKVDASPMKVEVVVGANDAPAAAAPKTLKDRISQPKPAKAQPKPATAAKPAAGRAGKGKARGGRAPNARKTKKTAEELDAEMNDYFVGGTAAGDDTAMTNGGTAQPAANGGDTGMEEDQIL